MAHKNSFSIVDVITFGWNTFKKNWQFLVVITLITLLVSFIPGQINSWAEENLPGIRFIISITGWLVNMVVSIGVVVIMLKIIDHKTPHFEDLWRHYPLLLNYFLASLLMGAIVILGLILLIIPGLYFAVKYHFMMYYVIDKKMGPMEALSESSKITEGIKWKLVGFSLATLGVMILGLLAFGIGILAAIPVVGLADAHLYRKLSSSDHAE